MDLSTVGGFPRVSLVWVWDLSTVGGFPRVSLVWVWDLSTVGGFPRVSVGLGSVHCRNQSGSVPDLVQTCWGSG